MKKCPDCAESVQQDARVCRFCGYRFDRAPGPAPAAVALSQAPPPAPAPPPMPAPALAGPRRTPKAWKLLAGVGAGLGLCFCVFVAVTAVAVGPRRSAGDDAAAKSDARYAVSQVESCYVDRQTYDACDTTLTGVDLGPEKGEVELRDATDDAYTVIAHSRSGHDFTIARTESGAFARTCDAAGEGGCDPVGNW